MIFHLQPDALFTKLEKDRIQEFKRRFGSAANSDEAPTKPTEKTNKPNKKLAKALSKGKNFSIIVSTLYNYNTPSGIRIASIN